MLQNFMSLDSPEADARSSRIAIKDELVGKLAFNDPRVFKRLALDRISPQFVTSCAESFKTDQRLLDARRDLDKIATMATGKAIEELEAEEEIQNSFGVQKLKKKVDEKKMYKPLATIFQHVEMFQDSSSTQSRHTFLSTDSTVLKSDVSTWGFPKGSPDFVMFDRSSSVSTSERKGVLWRNIGAFCEVKPTPLQGPRPSKDTTVVKPLVLQAADYARLHISARPFQLFSTGLLIFGSQFCVAIFDRDGILFSPIHDMWRDTEIFIRVIRSLTCHLSLVELGQDPTVTTLPEQEHRLWRAQTRELGRDGSDDFPTFVIMAGGRSWYTIGLPIWTSVSLLGRGTSIWLVRENGTGPVLVLKNMWRSASRISESLIYKSVTGQHPALAKLYQGEDVRFPGEERYITTNNLRGPAQIPVLDDNIERGDVVLHRLLLESRGRPLWEYRSEKELLQGLRAALNAHQFLCEQGILHRDISAGNIMLAAEDLQEAGAEGFLMDLEFAHIKRTSLDTTPTTVVPPIRAPSARMTVSTVRSHTIFGPAVMRGAAMTGTAQFMAVAILNGILSNKPIEHESQHDIESFLYVLAYSVTRRAVMDSKALVEAMRKELHDFFRASFGRMRLNQVLSSRDGPVTGPLSVGQRIPGAFSEPMVQLLSHLNAWLLQSRLISPWKGEMLSHAYLLEQLDKAIEMV